VRTRYRWRVNQTGTTAAENALKEQAETPETDCGIQGNGPDVQQATRDRVRPARDTLKELAQQVSAIRDTREQQDRVRTPGWYDWGIIRTFCLRVIRCVDNIENRIRTRPKTAKT
jgi:hypothetical protein